VRSLRRGTSTLDFEEFEKLGHLDAPTPNRVASPWQSDCRQREQEERRSEGCSSAASLEGGLSSSRQPAPSCELPAPATHEYMGDGTEDVETGYTSHLTIFSADSEYSSNTSSEAPESLCNGLRGESNGTGTLEPHRGLSPLVFDLLPNPSIDHLVAVILKYPRREESGRRKSLNPGPIG
jgi:hypothetical protein